MLIVTFTAIYLFFFFSSYSTITACPDNAIPHDLSDFFSNLLLSTRCPSELIEGDKFRWIKKFHQLSDSRKKLFWESNAKLNGNDVYMNKFLLRPLKELTTDDLEGVYKIFVGLSKDEQELMLQLKKASMHHLDNVTESNQIVDEDGKCSSIYWFRVLIYL